MLSVPEGTEELVQRVLVQQVLPCETFEEDAGAQEVADAPAHQGKGAGQTKSMTPSKIEEVMGHLKEHCYDLSFEQLAELSSVSASILCRFFCRQPGWRQVGKSTRPLDCWMIIMSKLALLGRRPT